MRTLILIGSLSLAFLVGCSQQDKEQARHDAKKAEQAIRDGAKTAGREIKKDLRAADKQLTESMEKGKVAAQHAGKELRKELSQDDSDSKRR